MNPTKALTTVALILAPLALAGAAARSDAQILRDASAAIYRAKGLDGSGILLDTTDGHVTLRGSVPSEKAKDRAAQMVRGVDGVVEVRNLLEVTAPEVAARPRRADVALRRDIERSLKGDRSLRYSRIGVQSVDQGVIVLNGDAATARDEARAIRLASVRPGVRQVVSRVRVANAIAIPPASTPIDLALPETPPETDDVVIQREVLSALRDLDAEVNAGVSVSVKDGVVWLTGTVPTWQGNNDRLHATRSIPGVRSIVNEVQVTR